MKKNEKFFKPIKRQNLKSMEDMAKKIKITSSKNKEVQFRQQSNVALQLLVQTQKQGATSLTEMLSYPLTPVPFSLGNPDGSLAKTDKAKGMTFVLKHFEQDPVAYDDTAAIDLENKNIDCRS